MRRNRKAERNYHHKPYHKLYWIYLHMKYRCYNKADSQYHRYGGRGILVSEEFLDKDTFINYIMSLPNYENREKDKLSLDRRDNDGNYERGNLRWATRTEQNSNRRGWKATIEIIDE